MLIGLPFPTCVGLDDTPVWMLYKSHHTEKYEPVLVAWHTYDQFEEKRFLTLRTFGTQEDAEAFAKEFWQTYWRLSL